MPNPSVASPAEPNARVELLDALRGFALFGVCLANLWSFGLFIPEVAATLSPIYVQPSLDRAATLLMNALVEGKFYSIFSLLFGLGFALQMQRAEARGADVLPLFKRRLRVLMGIGLAHLLLLWYGDILLFYGMMGFVLLRLRHVDDRRLLRWVFVLILLPIPFYLPVIIDRTFSLGTPFVALWTSSSNALGVPLDDPGYARMLAESSLRDTLAMNFTGLFWRFGELLFIGRPFKVLAMFVLGMLVGRHRMWARLDEFAPLLRRIASWGIGVGLPMSVAWAFFKDYESYNAGSWHGLLETTLYSLSVAPLAVGYAAAFALLWRSARGQQVLGVFAPAGRMALTNYLTQSVIGSVLFNGFLGLGLVSRVGPAWYLPIAITTISAQIIFSRFWLSRFRFGPMEWVWRSLTYRAAQPLVLARATSVVLLLIVASTHATATLR